MRNIVRSIIFIPLLLGLLVTPSLAFDKKEYIEKKNPKVNADRVLEVLSVAKEYSTPELDMELLMFCLAEPETTFDPNEVGDAGEHGLVQIHPIHKKCIKEAGLDYNKPEDLVRWGCIMITTSLEKGKTLRQALYPWRNTRSKALSNYYKFRS